MSPNCSALGRIALLLLGAIVAQDKTVSAQESLAGASKDAPFELSIAGLDRPIRVRLTVTVNGTPWRQHFDEVHQRYLKALFIQLDGDQDGVLAPGEASRLPAPTSWATLSAVDDVHVAFNFRVLDADADEKVSAAELDRYVRFFGNVSMRLITAATSQPNDELFRFLDANRDRILQASEWSTVAKLLERDRDGNRVLTAEELRGPMAVAAPPEFVATASGVRSDGRPLKLDLVSASEMTPDVEFLVDYSENARQAQKPRIQLKTGATATELGLRVLESAENEPVLVIGGRRLALRVPPPAVRLRSAIGQQLQSEFESVADASEQIVAASASMPPLLKSTFRIADRNDDGQLERPELEHYLNDLLAVQVTADAARLRLVESGERRGLMPVVDLNLDGRLSKRELQTLSKRLTTLAGETEQLRRDDLAPTIVMVLQHGPFSEATGENPLENAGPPWFFRADRNQDGDLDREEFLGTAEDFLRLDTNGDGWIELDEAVVGDPAAPSPDSEGKQ